MATKVTATSQSAKQSFASQDYKQLETVILKHMAFESEQCTHVGCDLGLNLHDCPQFWNRPHLKHLRLAYAYGISRNKIAKLYTATLKGITA